MNARNCESNLARWDLIESNSWSLDRIRSNELELLLLLLLLSNVVFCELHEEEGMASFPFLELEGKDRLLILWLPREFLREVFIGDWSASC